MKKRLIIGIIPILLSSCHGNSQTDCQVIETYANNGTIETLSPPPLDNAERKLVLSRFKEDDEMSWVPLDETYDTWSVRLNETAVVYDIAYVQEGSARVGAFYIKRVNGNKAQRDIEDEIITVHDGEEGYFDLRLLKIGEKYYFSSGYKACSEDRCYYGVSKIWTLDNTGTMDHICTYSTSSEFIKVEPEISNAPICPTLLTVKYLKLPFSEEGDVSDFDDPVSGSKLRTVSGIAKADLNSDGTAERLVRASIEHAGGRGCVSQTVFQVNQENNTITWSPINLATRKILELSCDVRTNVLQHEGRVYIEARYHGSGNRDVYHVVNDELVLICAFSGLPVHKLTWEKQPASAR